MKVPSDADFGSRLRTAAVAARVGIWLGVCFGVAFVTGLISHYAQEAQQPVTFPASPVWGYRVTQGLHVVAGTAAVPLLLVKLWTVYPLLFARLPRGSVALLRGGLERASIAVLVGAAVFQLSTGVVNVTAWYPWEFSFRRSHYAIAWVAVGALVLHVAVKLPQVRAVLGADVDDTRHDRPTAVVPGPVSRRGLLRITWLSAAAAVVVNASGTFPVLDRLAVLSARSSAKAPNGIPINGSAAGAGVVAAATAESYRCVVQYGDRGVRLARADLLALPQRTVELPIVCVEGWSASGRWTGVRLRDLLALVGAPGGVDVRTTSLQDGDVSSDAVLPANFADDDRALLALGLDGEPLSLDHGYPARLIAPNRPGVLQTKWVSRIEALG